MKKLIIAIVLGLALPCLAAINRIDFLGPEIVENGATSHSVYVHCLDWGGDPCTALDTAAFNVYTTDMGAADVHYEAIAAGNATPYAVNTAAHVGFGTYVIHLHNDVWDAGIKDFVIITVVHSTAGGCGGCVHLNAAMDADTVAGATPSTLSQSADAVWDEAAAGHIDAGKAGQQLWTDLDAVLVDTGTDGVVLINDAITGAKIAASAIGASELASNCITTDELASNCIGASELAPSASEEIADAIWNEAAVGHVDAGKAGAQLWTDIDTILSAVGAGYALEALVAVPDAVSPASKFTITAGIEVNDAYNFCVVQVVDGTDGHIEVRYVTDFVGATREITLNADLGFNAENGDTVNIVGTSYIGSTGNGNGGGGWW